MGNKRVAIACQGGGSHTAFTAGVLAQLLSDWPVGCELVGLSGTSGGAICASVAWSACIENRRELAGDRLKAIWRDISATSPAEQFLNAAMLLGASTRGFLPHLELSPYQLPTWGAEQFRETLQRHFDSSHLNSLKGPHSTTLYIGAVEVMEGKFEIFNSAEMDITVDMLLASAAIPNLYQAVEIDGKHYWDGLFSHNPPIVATLACQPDEIWIVQINPRQAFRKPRTVEEIQDRRNELAGNLSLEQEVSSIKMINAMLNRGEVTSQRCRPVTLRRIELVKDLNYASKLDRSPSFLAALMEEGSEQARTFLSTQYNEDHDT